MKLDSFNLLATITFRNVGQVFSLWFVSSIFQGQYKIASNNGCHLGPSMVVYTEPHQMLPSRHVSSVAPYTIMNTMSLYL